ncbi:MAG TPA: S9 family peptidase [Casimicrobiaceae bacterium]
MNARRPMLACIAALIAATLLPLALPVHAAEQDRLIPRKDIFGNPTRTLPAISPDGKNIAYIAPRDSVLNVFVAPRDDIAAAKPITADKKRGIRGFFWAQNSKQLIYTQDEGGDENWRIHVVGIATAQDSVISPAGKVQGQVLATSVTKPDEILIGINDRDPQNHDVYRHNLKTGEQKLLFTNEDGYNTFVADDSLALRMAAKQTPGGGLEVFKRDSAGKMTSFTRISPEDALTTQFVGFDVAGTTLYALDSRGRDKAALVTIDVDTGAPKVLAESDKADVSGTLAHPATGKVQAAQIDYLRDEWQAIDPAIKGDIEFLNANARGQWKVTSRSHDDMRWTVQVDRVTEPVAFWMYDRGAKQFTKLFTARPNLEGAPLSPMYPVEIKVRDGLTLVSYLTLPRGTDPGGSGKPSKALPMVLYVHGGPWYRDSFGYNPTHQWLANRGYAVLSVNYRGSTGFGKKFVNIADMQFAGTMHDDLIDAVKWAIDKGIAEKDKIAIMGGSYGGYATLVGMTFTPDTFACGVDIVGPSNLVTLIESFPPYWQPFMEVSWYKHVGDPRTEEGKKFLLTRSPITRVDQIKRPLLIGQGANDPRVTRKESDQIVAAMNARKIPVTYAIYTDEGHGFARPENRISFYAIAENFLSTCLAGRAEPIGDDAKGAALAVPDGASNVPGLKDALAALPK